MVDPGGGAWLAGKGAIRAHLGGIGEEELQRLVEAGLPVWREGRTWFGYTGEIDAWMREWREFERFQALTAWADSRRARKRRV